jgi:hypothetical protein
MRRIKFQIPSTKFQINNKFQIPITQTKTLSGSSLCFDRQDIMHEIDRASGKLALSERGAKTWDPLG